jgi:hypothetical protein
MDIFCDIDGEFGCDCDCDASGCDCDYWGDTD